MLPPGFTTASAERDLSLLSRIPEGLSWRAEELLPPDTEEVLLRVTPLEDEVFCFELERPPLTDDELRSEVLRPTEDLLSEVDLPRFIVEVLREDEVFTEDDLLLESEEEDRTALPDFRDEELPEDTVLRLLEEDDDDELLLEELLSEEDLRVVVVVVLLPLSLRVCASTDGAAHKSAPASNATNGSLEMFITQIFICPQVRSTAWRTLVNISMLSPL